MLISKKQSPHERIPGTTSRIPVTCQSRKVAPAAQQLIPRSGIRRPGQSYKRGEDVGARGQSFFNCTNSGLGRAVQILSVLFWVDKYSATLFVSLVALSEISPILATTEDGVGTGMSVHQFIHAGRLKNVIYFMPNTSYKGIVSNTIALIGYPKIKIFMNFDNFKNENVHKSWNLDSIKNSAGSISST